MSLWAPLLELSNEACPGSCEHGDPAPMAPHTHHRLPIDQRALRQDSLLIFSFTLFHLVRAFLLALNCRKCPTFRRQN